MAATTRTEVFAFESNLNSAFRQWMDDHGFELFANGVIDTPPSDFIAVETEIGAATGHYSPLGAAFVYDQYQFSVTFRVKSRRFEDESVSIDDIDTLHNALIANVRRWMSYLEARGSALETYLDLYAINTFVPSGTSGGVSGEKDETELSYEGQFTIKPDAWPS